MSIRLYHDTEYVEAQVGHAYLPFGYDTAESTTGTTFKTFGFTGDPSTGDTTFLPGWKILTPLGSSFSQLRAMFHGGLWLQKTEDSSYAAGHYHTLYLAVTDPTLSRALQHLKPSWLPAPSVVIYQNIDIDLFRQAILDWDDESSPHHNPDIVATNMDTFPEDVFALGSWESMIDRYLDDVDAAGVSSFEISVLASQVIGRAGADSETSGSVSCTFYFRSLGDDTNILGEDPNDLYYNPGFYVEGWPELFLNEADHPFLIQAAAVSWGPVTNRQFRYVKKTGGVSGSSESFTDPARPASTITEAISRADAHDTIVILDNSNYAESELSITKPLTLTSLSVADATSSTTASTDFPQLDGSDSHRVLKIDLSGYSEPGMVCLRSVTVRDGYVIDPGGDGYLGGAGVLVYESDQTVIQNCYVLENRTVFGTWARFDLEAMIQDNIANPAKREALAIALASLAAQDDLTLTALRNGGLNAHGYGAGIGLIKSSAFIYKNRITSNTSCGRGAGISFAGWSWPVIDSNVIDSNVASQTSVEEGPEDGGGIASHVVMPTETGVGMNYRMLDMATEMIAHIEGMGLTEFYGVFNLGASLYPFMKQFLTARAPTWFSSKTLTKARYVYAVIRGNTINGNECMDDGGGVYLTAGSQCYFFDNDIYSNKAREGAGGGIRSTFASNVVIDSSRIYNNESNSTGIALDEHGNGGGGIAFRNVSLDIKDSEIHDNTANGWAGGAMYFSASDDGGFLFTSGRLFQAMLVDPTILNFTTCTVTVDAATRITSNTATHIDGQDDHGKGGGMYLYRHDMSDVPKLLVTITGYESVVTSNAGSFTDADQLTLYDDVENLTIDDSSSSDYITGITFSYSSLAAVPE